ncbi:hypothetical protein DL96DRAFT_1563819 [Flagelloscypha sp. PMI_526]|nr:hypothetical protein DL96DRAFT_1563819 [Flagelloscypha sp. PMI_526]
MAVVSTPSHTKCIVLDTISSLNWGRKNLFIKLNYTSYCTNPLLQHSPSHTTSPGPTDSNAPRQLLWKWVKAYHQVNGKSSLTRLEDDGFMRSATDARETTVSEAELDSHPNHLVLVLKRWASAHALVQTKPNLALFVWWNSRVLGISLATHRVDQKERTIHFKWAPDLRSIIRPAEDTVSPGSDVWLLLPDVAAFAEASHDAFNKTDLAERKWKL